MRYLIGFLVTIGLIVLIIILLFRGSGSNTPASTLSLPSYATNLNSQAEFIIDGPVQADETHRQVKIDVSEISITMSIYQGYNENTIYSETLPNNRTAYTAFLYSLQRAGFTNRTASVKGDELGQCPSGSRFIMSFNDGSKQLLRSWYTTCGSGTFKGTFNTVSYLFKGQVPNYADKTSMLGL